MVSRYFFLVVRLDSNLLFLFLGLVLLLLALSFPLVECLGFVPLVLVGVVVIRRRILGLEPVLVGQILVEQFRFVIVLGTFGTPLTTVFVRLK